MESDGFPSHLSLRWTFEAEGALLCLMYSMFVYGGPYLLRSHEHQKLYALPPRL